MLSQTRASISEQFDQVYKKLQRDTSISRVERSELVRQNFENILLANLSSSVGGYFYKRKSYYFNKNEQAKSSFFADILSKIGTPAVKYDKRYFKIDVKESTFSYARDESLIDKNPQYKVMLRDIRCVKKNVVSMPEYDKEGKLKFVEHSIFELNDQIDRGPNSRCQNVFEIKVSNRMFTLYTDDNLLMEKFVLYLEKLIELGQELRLRQREEDE